MANLKELRNKISGIQSIRKVTSAMKLVASVKLRKAEQKALESREYAFALNNILCNIHREQLHKAYDLLDGRERIKTELLVVFASDKGFCGNFNYLLFKEMRDYVSNIHNLGRNVQILCIGRKLVSSLKNIINENDKLDLISDFYSGEQIFNKSKSLSAEVINRFINKEVDKVSVIYTHFYSSIRMDIKNKDLIPLVNIKNSDNTKMVFEPSESDILEDSLKYNIMIQLYQSALESMASEQSSRMSSMDNATRNADDMLSDLSIRYNRTRQQGITQELVEVVAGANAVSER